MTVTLSLVNVVRGLAVFASKPAGRHRLSFGQDQWRAMGEPSVITVIVEVAE